MESGDRRVRSPLARRSVAILLVAAVLIGVILVALASVPEVTLRETRRFQGEIGPLREDGDALAVPGAAYTGVGFARAVAANLTCGVGIVFLTDPEWEDFRRSDRLPQPHLHCEQTEASLSGAIAAVFVENQRLNASHWSFALSLFEVDRPYASLGLPAIGLLLVGGVGLAVIIFQRMLVGALPEEEVVQEEEGKKE